MKGKNFFGKLSVLCLMIVALAISALAVPVEVTRVELNDVHMTPLTVNKLSLERGNEVEVEVRLLGLEDADNLELQAFLSGYEHNDVQRLAAYSKVFSIEKDELEVKKFKLRLPDDLEEDTYRLRILVSDRNGDELLQSYTVKIDVPRHKLTVEDVLVYPNSAVKAGQALLVSVRVANDGEKDEKDVKVTVTLPDLGLSQSTYLEEVEADEEEQTEELYLRLPSDTPAGTYDLVTTVSFNNGYREAEPHKTAVTVVKAEEPKTDKEEEKENTEPVKVTVESQPTPTQTTTTTNNNGKLRRSLEVVLLVLVALLVVIGLIIGFSKLRDEEDDE